MEKFLLGTFLSYNKLDIINEKNIIIAVFFPEFCGCNVVFVTDRIDQFIGESLGTDIEDLCAWVIFKIK